MRPSSSIRCRGGTTEEDHIDQTLTDRPHPTGKKLTDKEHSVPTYKDSFPSVYRDAADPKDWPEGKDSVTETMTFVDFALLGEDKDRVPILHFTRGKSAKLNKTSWKVIAGLYGEDSETWAMKPITLYKSETNSPQGVVPCVRFRGTPEGQGKLDLPTPVVAGADDDAPLFDEA
jgi:hypothetical protein